MLRSVDKENRLSFTATGQLPNTIKTKTLEKVIVGLNGQKDPSNVSGFTAQRINFEVFESEIKRLSETCDNERKEAWAVTQTKNKLENQVKVLNVQKNNLETENRRVRTELNDVITKMRDVQNKANQQISDFYTMKNQNASLQIEAKQQKESSQKWQKKYSALQANHVGLQAQTMQLRGEIGTWRNQCSLRDTEIQLLKRALFQLETENKRLVEAHGKCTQVSDQKLNQICHQVQNWKTAFEKKEQELETKTMVLSEQNNIMRKTLDELTAQCSMNIPKTSLMRSCSLPTEVSEKNNEYYVRLFVKENQIDKLNETIKTLQENVETLKLENALLNKKCTEGTVFSPSGYQRYTEVQNSILKNNDLKKQTRNLQTELQTKEREAQCLAEKLSEANQQIESITIECRKLESETQLQRISSDNKIGELTSAKARLERQTETLKAKLQSLQRECQDKDKIIINYVNKQKV